MISDRLNSLYAYKLLTSLATRGLMRTTNSMHPTPPTFIPTVRIFRQPIPVMISLSRFTLESMNLIQVMIQRMSIIMISLSQLIILFYIFVILVQHISHLAIPSLIYNIFISVIICLARSGTIPTFMVRRHCSLVRGLLA